MAPFKRPSNNSKLLTSTTRTQTATFRSTLRSKIANLGKISPMRDLSDMEIRETKRTCKPLPSYKEVKSSFSTERIMKYCNRALKREAAKPRFVEMTDQRGNRFKVPKHVYDNLHKLPPKKTSLTEGPTIPVSWLQASPDNSFNQFSAFSFNGPAANANAYFPSHFPRSPFDVPLVSVPGSLSVSSRDNSLPSPHSSHSGSLPQVFCSSRSSSDDMDIDPPDFANHMVEANGSSQGYTTPDDLSFSDGSVGQSLQYPIAQSEYTWGSDPYIPQIPWGSDPSSPQMPQPQVGFPEPEMTDPRSRYTLGEILKAIEIHNAFSCFSSSGSSQSSSYQPSPIYGIAPECAGLAFGASQQIAIPNL